MRKLNEHTIIIQSSVNEQHQFLKKVKVSYLLKCLYTVTHCIIVIITQLPLCIHICAKTYFHLKSSCKTYIFTLKVPSFIRPCLILKDKRLQTAKQLSKQLPNNLPKG